MPQVVKNHKNIQIIDISYILFSAKLQLIVGWIECLICLNECYLRVMAFSGQIS
jgi:hypothetical protein